MALVDTAIPQLIILYLTKMASDDLPIVFEINLHPVLAFFDGVLVNVQPFGLIAHKGEVVIEVFDLH